MRQFKAQEDCPIPTETPTPTPTPTQSTAVQLLGFTADGITVTWETGIEINTVGFNVWRAFQAEGPYEQANDILILAKSPGSITGDVYIFTDDAVYQHQICYYKLEEVATDGGSWYGPISNNIATDSVVTIRNIGIESSPDWNAIGLIVLGVVCMPCVILVAPCVTLVVSFIMRRL